VKSDPGTPVTGKPPRITGLTVEVRPGPNPVSVEQQEAWAESYLAHILEQDGLPSLQDDDSHEAA
jgi:hypothetical protein